MNNIYRIKLNLKEWKPKNSINHRLLDNIEFPYEMTL
jgi:hypothetical protein